VFGVFSCVCQPLKSLPLYESVKKYRAIGQS